MTDDNSGVFNTLVRVALLSIAFIAIEPVRLVLNRSEHTPYEWGAGLGALGIGVWIVLNGLLYIGILLGLAAVALRVAAFVFNAGQQQSEIDSELEEDTIRADGGVAED